MICAKFKTKISVHFVTSVLGFILNNVSTNLYHENEDGYDADAFDLQEKYWDSLFMF